MYRIDYVGIYRKKKVYFDGKPLAEFEACFTFACPKVSFFFPFLLASCVAVLISVLGIRIRRLRMFFGLPDPDPLVRGTDPGPSLFA
jgi:hypothetical protein